MTGFKPPPYKPKAPPVWATYVKTRTPQFKVHSSHGPAHNAIYLDLSGKGPRGGVIYKLVDNRWLQDERVQGPDLAGAAEPGICASCEGQIWDDDQYLCEECR